MNAKATKSTKTTVTREALKNGKFRFRVNGEVVLKASNRAYAWASLYQRPDGEVVAWFHARQDLALKGHREANGISDLKRVGTVEITEYAPATRELTREELDEVQRSMDLDAITAELDSNPWDVKPTTTTEENTVTENATEKKAPAKKAAKAEPKKAAAPRRPEVRATAEGKRVVKTKNYTVKEVAELLDSSPISVNRWVQMGKLSAVKSDPKEGRVVNLIPGASIADFLKGRADRAKATEKAKADKAAAAEKAKADRAAKKAAKATKAPAKATASKAKAPAKKATAKKA